MRTTITLVMSDCGKHNLKNLGLNFSCFNNLQHEVSEKIGADHLLSIVEKLAHRVEILHQGTICKDFLIEDLANGATELEAVFMESTA